MLGHDVRDLTPITPAHLALGRSLFNLPDIQDEDSVNESATRQRYLYQQKLVNHFWKRWRGEYLHQLSIRQKWMDEQPALKVGDILLISEDNAPRGKWPMGRVDRLFAGRDGLIRTITLNTQRGLLRRPVQRLHRLEASSTQFASGEFDDSGPSLRSRRKRGGGRGRGRGSKNAGGRGLGARDEGTPATKTAIFSF